MGLSLRLRSPSLHWIQRTDLQRTGRLPLQLRSLPLQLRTGILSLRCPCCRRCCCCPCCCRCSRRHWIRPGQPLRLSDHCRTRRCLHPPLLSEVTLVPEDTLPTLPESF